MLPTSDAYKTAITQKTRVSKAGLYFGLYDISAREDAQVSVNTSQSFIDTQNIVDGLTVPEFQLATFEDNYFKLDGSMCLVPDDIGPTYNFGWMSQSMSGADALFVVSPVVQIDFDDIHTCTGIEVYFDPLGGSYCKHFDIEWLMDGVRVFLLQETQNTQPIYRLQQDIGDYNKIIITIYETDKPYRYARIAEVNFGKGIEIDNSDIVRASIIEEVDPISGVISMNKLTLTLLNLDQRFNMINPNGIYKNLQRKQLLIPQSKLQLANGSFENIEMGTYYLTIWKNFTGITADFEATDIMGLLDKTTYYRSHFWVNEPVRNVLSDIFEDAGNYSFTVSAEISAETITGYIPICSHRMAIQYVLIACKASIRCERSGLLNIFRPRYDLIHNQISKSMITGKPQIEQKPLITSVTLKRFNFAINIEEQNLYEESLDLIGAKEIIIPINSAPVSSMQASVTGNATIVSEEYTATTAILNLNCNGSFTIIINGYIYDKTEKIITAKIGSIPAGEVYQSVNIEDNSLICDDIKALSIAQNILDYYGKRIKQKFDYWCDPAMQAGDNVSVETMFNTYQSGIIEHQYIEFAPSLKAQMEVTG